MKFNWGHGITIFILLFMGFIITLVVKTFSQSADLVRDDFYEQEALYDGKKQSILNYNQSNIQIDIKQTPEAIVIKFPNNFKYDKGSVYFYRADDKSLDKTYDLKLNQKKLMLLNYNNFIVGKYDISINWSFNSKSYLYETSISF